MKRFYFPNFTEKMCKKLSFGLVLTEEAYSHSGAFSRDSSKTETAPKSIALSPHESALALLACNALFYVCILTVSVHCSYVRFDQICSEKSSMFCSRVGFTILVLTNHE